MGDIAPAFERRPIFGQPVQVPPARRPLALIFVRPLGCPLGRATIAGIVADFERLDAAGLSVAVVTPSPLAHAQDFVPRHQLLFPLVADSEAEIFERYNLKKADFRVMIAAAPALLRAASTHGVATPGPQRVWLGGSFLIGVEGRVLLASYAEGLAMHVDVQALVEAAR